MLIKINHRRKGIFKALLLADYGEWIKVQIVGDTVKYISDEDLRFGDVLTIRKSFCKIEVLNDCGSESV